MLKASSRPTMCLTLKALVELAIYRHAISIRNQAIPSTCPPCGHSSLVSITPRPSPGHHRPRRPGAGAHRAGDQAAAQAGDPDRAEALARTITDPNAQAEALTELARRGRPGR